MTNKKIETITDEQKAQIEIEREKWRAIGTCTDPADRPTTEKILTKFYARIGQPAPKFVWFADAKEACEKGAAEMGITPREVFELRNWGSEYAWWVAWYVVARDVVGVEYTPEQNELLNEWAELVKSAGWFFPGDGICLCAERHEELHFDPQYRLHCETGPAIKGRGDLKVYAWHGTRIPAEWIEDKENLKPEVALNWQNVEQRRCAAEIIGWNKILEQIPTKVIDQDADPMIGTLIECDIPDSPKSRFIKVRCGTGRDFVLPVPNEMKTALEANAWTYNIDGDTFKKMQLRT